MNKTSARNRSAASWLVELAKGRYGEYALSVLTPLLGFSCSLIPYFIIIPIIAALVNGEVTESVPATVLQRHPDCVVIVDEAAAALIK